MQLEHVAIEVADPEALKAWWTAHLGMRLSAANPAFLVDDTGRGVLEVYRSENTPAAPDYATRDPSTFHIAFWADDVEREAARLEAAGAVRVETIHRPGFDMVMLRDPFGLCVQLCHRGESVFMPPR